MGHQGKSRDSKRSLSRAYCVSCIKLKVFDQISVTFIDFLLLSDQNSKTLDEHSLILELSVERLDGLSFIRRPIFKKTVEELDAVDFFLIGLTILQSRNVLANE